MHGVSDPCTHLELVERLELPNEVHGCEECLRLGDRWEHLRMCHTCGKIVCCDSSPNRHARAHYRDDGHPLFRSAEPGETWTWCYADEVTLFLTED